MSRYIKDNDCGSARTGAQELQTGAAGEQTVYEVKLVFPRGDAFSLLLDCNMQGKVTGISLMSMAGA